MERQGDRGRVGIADRLELRHVPRRSDLGGLQAERVEARGQAQGVAEGPLQSLLRFRVGDRRRPRHVPHVPDDHLASPPLPVHRDQDAAMRRQPHARGVMRQLREVGAPPQPPLPRQRLPRGLRLPCQRDPLAVRHQRQPRHPPHMPEHEMQVRRLHPARSALRRRPGGRLLTRKPHPKRDRRPQPGLQYRPPAHGHLPQLPQQRPALVVQLDVLVAHQPLLDSL